MNVSKKNIVRYGIAVLAIAAISFLVLSQKNSPPPQQTQSGTEQKFGEANLTWNPNKEADVIGYRVYYGDKKRTEDCPQGGYTEKVDVGNKTTYKVERLKNDTTYYFSVTSYNKAGKESCFSAEMSKAIKL